MLGNIMVRVEVPFGKFMDRTQNPKLAKRVCVQYQNVYVRGSSTTRIQTEHASSWWLVLFSEHIKKFSQEIAVQPKSTWNNFLISLVRKPIVTFYWTTKMVTQVPCKAMRGRSILTVRIAEFGPIRIFNFLRREPVFQVEGFIQIRSQLTSLLSPPPLSLAPVLFVFFFFENLIGANLFQIAREKNKMITYW